RSAPSVATSAISAVLAHPPLPGGGPAASRRLPGLGDRLRRTPDEVEERADQPPPDVRVEPCSVQQAPRTGRAWET
ncbi:hypothetical protein, partial [Streptomyces sp. NPDC059744]|uniref:hypothetical protein n=1 Tax=Streptomyces sp. NPDC059744 TaxID=3346929 RepID=UPI003652235C